MYTIDALIKELCCTTMAQKAEENKKKGLIANRSDCEKDLKFAGFIAFNCLNRTDSSAVLGELQHSGHHVIMITGDAILTGLCYFYC